MGEVRDPTRGLTALAAIGIGALLARRIGDSLASRGREPQPQGSRRSPALARASRKLESASALLAMSVLGDSGMEHYRGSFKNRAMFTPLLTASAALASSSFGMFDDRPQSHPVRDAVYAASFGVGLAGFAFHFYNVTKRPGGLSWLNVFYGAPIGAPIAMTLSGLLGRAAERTREAHEPESAKFYGLRADHALTAVCCCGLLGTVGEAALLHFRGSFQDPFMFLPVTVPPIAVGALAVSAGFPSRRTRSAARWTLRATAALGVLGVGFHSFGIARNMGGWRNWSQNILNGPPLPAPPSFTGLALAGLACIDLLEKDAHVETLS